MSNWCSPTVRAICPHTNLVTMCVSSSAIAQPVLESVLQDIMFRAKAPHRRILAFTDDCLLNTPRYPMIIRLICFSMVWSDQVRIHSKEGPNCSKYTIACSWKAMLIGARRHQVTTC